MASTKTYKAIIYDLDTNALKIHYKKGDWHNAYKDIGRFMHEHNFRWVQGSGYFSNEKIDKYQMQEIVIDLLSSYPWANQCVKDCRQLDVTAENNLSIYFTRGREEMEKRQIEEKISKIPPQLTPNGRVDIDAKLAEYKKKRIAEGTLKPSMQNKGFHR